MVNLLWLTVHFGLLTFCCHGVFLFSLFHVDDRNIHEAPFLGLVRVCARCTVFSCDVRSGALFSTPWYCGFVALLSRTPFRAVSMWYCISHTCLSKMSNCSLVWCVVFARLPCCFRIIGMRSLVQFFSVNPPTHPGRCPFAAVFGTWPVWSGLAPFVFPNARASLAVQVFWLTTAPHGARSFSKEFRLRAIAIPL